jgi:cytochrome c peroxidase
MRERSIGSVSAALRKSAFLLLVLLGGLLVAAITGATEMPRPQLGLPSVQVPETNPQTPAKISLGKKLFFDTRLSGDGTISCASCHQTAMGLSDGRPLAQGIHAQVGTRHTPSLWNVAYNETQFWDGRRASLEAQALDPLTNPLEHGLETQAELLHKLSTDSTYPHQFQAAFPHEVDPVNAANVARALASFERTLTAAGSPFDEFFYGHKAGALDRSAQRGLKLFREAGRCATCHSIGRDNALFTDNSFHSANIGLSRIASKLPALTSRLVSAKRSGAPIDYTVLSDRDIAELGRFVVTLDPADIGKFRTPTLRNVALTAPYMHDGSVATLRIAVERELYDHAQPGRPLILTPQDKDDLVAFLNALTSPTALQLTKRLTSR